MRKIEYSITLQAGKIAQKFIDDLGDDLISVKSYINDFDLCELNIKFYVNL